MWQLINQLAMKVDKRLIRIYVITSLSRKKTGHGSFLKEI